MSEVAETNPNPVSACRFSESTEDFIFRALGLSEMYARMARDFIQAGDRAGFRYSLTQLASRVRAVVDIVNTIERQAKQNADE